MTGLAVIALVFMVLFGYALKAYNIEKSCHYSTLRNLNRMRLKNRDLEAKVILFEAEIDTKKQVIDNVTKDNFELREKIQILDEHLYALEHGYLQLSARFEDYIEMVESRDDVD